MITFYGSRYIDDCLPVEGSEVNISGLPQPAVVNNDGMYIFGSDGKKVNTQCRVLAKEWLSGAAPHYESNILFATRLLL